jgi:multiple sugar transport system substrate-binding protein
MLRPPFKLFLTLLLLTVFIASPVRAQSSDPVTITVMIASWALTDEEIQAFEDANPDIAVERIEEDGTRLNAMFAAGTPPDVFSVSGADIPSLVNRDLLLDLRPYFESSEVLRADDLIELPFQYFRVGEGWYGMNRDWSPDQSIWINKRAFEEAGIPIPDPSVPPTYAQIAEWAETLTSMRGDRTVRMGWHDWFNDAVLQTILMEQGQDLYSEDFTQAIIKDNPVVVDVLRYFADLAEKNHVWNPLNPSQLGVDVDILQGQLGGAVFGYWFHGVVVETPDVTIAPGDLQFMRGATWFGETAINIPFGGAGAAIAKASANPDAAWRFFEYYMGGEPARTRAASGWGVPALKSLLPLMPQETDFDKQTFEILQLELENVGEVRRLNPYYSTNVFNTSWNTNLERYLKDEITFEQLVENLDADVNAAIQEGIAAATN